jgi:hypothetical protein
MDDERLLACAASGEVSLFEAGELRQVLANLHPGSAPLRAIVPFARGFIVAGDRGLLSLHERTEDNAFVPLKTFTCQGALARIVGNLTPGTERRPDAITSISLSPSEDVLYCTSGDCQVSAFPLKDVDILRADSAEDHFAPLGGGFHQGAVTGMDICTRKPMIATCSTDHTVRVWNYAERTCLQARTFVEEPLSVAFHPSGYHLAVGFGDKLRFFNLLVDDLKLVHEFHLKVRGDLRSGGAALGWDRVGLGWLRGCRCAGRDCAAGGMGGVPALTAALHPPARCAPARADVQGGALLQRRPPVRCGGGS